MKDLMVPVSPGEVIDKLTILELKSERIADPARLANVRHELSVLARVAAVLPGGADLAALRAELAAINATLWRIEDDIRLSEARRDFGPDFVALARSVYRTNDQRAEVKRRINLLLGSALIEEKSYADAGPAQDR